MGTGHTPLWSLFFSTAHLSSVSSLGLLPSFLGFSGACKIREASQVGSGPREGEARLSWGYMGGCQIELRHVVGFRLSWGYMRVRLT